MVAPSAASNKPRLDFLPFASDALARVYRPAQADFNDTRLFTTDGHHKAKGVNLAMRFPSSWKAKEPDSPNVVQMFVSENGTGFQMAQILVKAIPYDGAISRQEIESLLWEDKEAFLPSDTVLHKHVKTAIYGEPAAVIEYSGVRPFGMTTAKLHCYTVAFFQKNNMVNITFTSGDQVENGSDADLTFDNFRGLFEFMMSTIVLPEKFR